MPYSPDEIRAMADELEAYRAYNPDTDRDDHTICEQAAAMLRAIADDAEQWVDVLRASLGVLPPKA